MFNTVSGKKIAIFGFAFKKDTGDVRETPGIRVCELLMEDGAVCQVYDPKVQRADAISEFEAHSITVNDRLFVTCHSPEEAVLDSHAIVVLTEWDCFKSYDYKKFFGLMQKPAFLFDGRNILDHEGLQRLGFEVHAIGKSLENDGSFLPAPVARPDVTVSVPLAGMGTGSAGMGTSSAGTGASPRAKAS